MDITFEQAFKSWVLDSTRFWNLVDGDRADHQCGWAVPPMRAELMGGHIIYACWGCGDCYRENDQDNNSVEMVAA